MKTILSLTIVFTVLILPEMIVLYFWQTDGEILWRIFKDWLDVIVPVVAIAGIIFASWRGKSYKELQELANTREKKISDLTAENIKLTAKIEHLEDEREELREKNLRLQGDVDQIHRTKG